MGGGDTTGKGKTGKHRGSTGHTGGGRQHNRRQNNGPNVAAAAATLLGAAATSTSEKRDTPTNQQYPPGVFDFYAFAQSWSPAFCCAATGSVCQKEKIAGLTDVSTHGLWPQFFRPDGAGKLWPEFCVKPAKGDLNGMSGRQRHEYTKHGTCTRLSPQRYLDQEASLANSASLQPAREYLRENAKGAVDTATLVEKLGGPKRAAIKVDNKCRLSEMTTCWSRGEGDTVASQVECPDVLLNSERNSAVKYGCVRVLLGEANSCAVVTDQMLKFLKGKAGQGFQPS